MVPLQLSRQPGAGPRLSPNLPAHPPFWVSICRTNDEGNAQYQWAGGPDGYPAGSDLPAGTGGSQVLLAGTDWGNDNITRPEMHHVLGDNWDSNRDEGNLERSPVPCPSDPPGQTSHRSPGKRTPANKQNPDPTCA